MCDVAALGPHFVTKLLGSMTERAELVESKAEGSTLVHDTDRAHVVSLELCFDAFPEVLCLASLHVGPHCSRQLSLAHESLLLHLFVLLNLLCGPLGRRRGAVGIEIRLCVEVRPREGIPRVHCISDDVLEHITAGALRRSLYGLEAALLLQYLPKRSRRPLCRDRLQLLLHLRHDALPSRQHGVRIRRDAHLPDLLLRCRLLG
mmetsp:Transcript_21/g.69  ORF Transcript_21/g.69 Transcript_21/m.69 type:complete len:204 (-) Transcript_21:347-958(-)